MQSNKLRTREVSRSNVTEPRSDARLSPPLHAKIKSFLISPASCRERCLWFFYFFQIAFLIVLSLSGSHCLRYLCVTFSCIILLKFDEMLGERQWLDYIKKAPWLSSLFISFFFRFSCPKEASEICIPDCIFQEDYYSIVLVFISSQIMC